MCIRDSWETELEYYGNESEETQLDECDDDGYAAYTGSECECREYEHNHITRVDKDGDEYEEYVDCSELDDEDELLEGFGIDDTDDCPCEEWYEEEYTLYWNEIRHQVLLSTKPVLDIIGEDRWDGLLMDHLDFGSDTHVIKTDDTEYDDNYEEATEWDYHNDRDGEIISVLDEYEMEGSELLYNINTPVSYTHLTLPTILRV